MSYSNFNTFKLFQNVGINSSSNYVLSMKPNDNNVSFHSSNSIDYNNVDIMSIKNIINKKQNEDLNLSSLTGTTINPVITINNNHSDCRIMTNLNVNGNVNVLNGEMIRTTGIGSFGSITTAGQASFGGNIEITGQGTFGSHIQTTGQGSFGSLAVASSTQVTNLNAHKLGGNLPSAFATANHNHSAQHLTPASVGINTALPTGATKLIVDGEIHTTNSLLYFAGGTATTHYVQGANHTNGTVGTGRYVRQYIQMQTPNVPTTQSSPLTYNDERDWFIGTQDNGGQSKMLFSTRTSQYNDTYPLRYAGYIFSNVSSLLYGDPMNFTGQHRCVPQNIDFYNNIDNYVGLIVYATGDYKTYSNSQEKLTTDKEAITINDSLPIIDLSNKKKQKSVFGIISNKEEEERTYNAGVFCTPYPNTGDDKRLYINSVGEGAIWIVNTNGNLENGDYIQASDVIGMGEKQDDDILHNYTVAKITCDCNFDISSTKYNCVEFVDPTSGNTYKKAFVGCSYHCG